MMTKFIMSVLILSQLSDLTPIGPSANEIWNYFSNKIMPIIGHWQVESTPGPVVPGQVAGPSVINTWLTNLLNQFEKNKVSIF